MPPKVDRHKAAIGRTEASRPLKLAMEAGFVTPERSYFDYGCGRGDDVRRLQAMGISALGWDPGNPGSKAPRRAEVVNLGYVVNVIEDATERAQALRNAWDLAQSVLLVAARLTIDVKDVAGKPYRDGILTRLGTFQKFYQQSELRSWIDETLDTDSVAASPGVFFVFRDLGLRESYLAARYTRRRAAPKLRKSNVLFEQHKDILQPLLEFLTDRARLPETHEVATGAELTDVFGSLRRAFAVVKRVTGTDPWDIARVERYQDLLVHFALARFDKNRRMSDLPADLQLDVREFFSSYKAACESADRLLFSAGDMDVVEKAMAVREVGKLTPSALYIHADALPRLSPVLRVYEGCARRYVGDVAGANLIKLHRGQPRVSYLSYPTFDTAPHPALDSSLVVALSELSLDYTLYRERDNPPVLHRKETFLSQDDPRHGKFERLTRQEERWGLYEQPERIGTRQGWESVLTEAGCAMRGHRVVRTNKPTGDA
jgi:DNA phosphorothioation-associated putative methyltransferase